MENYILWDDWVQAFSALRAAFSRQSTYLWCMAICAGMMIRRDLNGVTSFVRSLGLSSDRAYHSMLRVFTSAAIDRQLLIKLWFNLALRLFNPLCVNGRIVLICDGITIAKEGKRMPGVKLLHQSSSSNAKAEFVMGHSIGAISLGVVAPNHKLTSGFRCVCTTKIAKAGVKAGQKLMTFQRNENLINRFKTIRHAEIEASYH